MKSPLDYFFALGDKVTKGNPQRKADFDYYMLWIIFLAFASIWATYVWKAVSGSLGAALWSVVLFGICWFQYFSIKNVYEMRKMKKSIKPEAISEKIESVDEMLEGFKN